MNILAINGSPKGSAGNTEVLIRAFLDGAAQTGDSTETVYLKEKKIERCVGCLSCWFKTPGVCVFKDDMAELLEKIRCAEILIFGSPLYFFNFTGIMKDFTDRLVPFWQPFIDFEDGISTHPSRYKDFKPKAVVLISNSAFPEQVHFDGMKQIFNSVAQGFRPAKPNIICCAGGVLLKMPEARDIITWYVDAVKKAGSEVARDGAIHADTQEILERPLIDDAKAYSQRANALWESMGLKRI
ncbi:MAG: flavodoxin family protein [Armatimonadota bacterium]